MHGVAATPAFSRKTQRHVPSQGKWHFTGRQTRNTSKKKNDAWHAGARSGIPARSTHCRADIKWDNRPTAPRAPPRGRDRKARCGGGVWQLKTVSSKVDANYTMHGYATLGAVGTCALSMPRLCHALPSSLSHAMLYCTCLCYASTAFLLLTLTFLSHPFAILYLPLCSSGMREVYRSARAQISSHFHALEKHTSAKVKQLLC